jgi:saccharopine dehydrogenase-like NADP-dependent oxidoreductase
MNNHFNIIIVGAGGIARAAGLILVELSAVCPTIYLGHRTLSGAQRVAQWIEAGTSKPCSLKPFEFRAQGLNPEMEAILNLGDILLDCLPGSLAPSMARYAREYQLHYVNLTEYVDETNQIKALAKDVKTGFILQSGLAPGYINVLGHKLFQDFCKEFKVNQADSLKLRVGALTNHAVSPHFYGFTWSAVGVANEYLMDALVIRNFEKTLLPSLSGRADLILNGIRYEEDLTSGGAADLPEALAGKVRTLDYKSLRYPGHFNWVERQIENFRGTEDPVLKLQRSMEDQIPQVEDDLVILYAVVEGKDHAGTLQRREVFKHILPRKVGKYRLRAIQVTTAAALIQSAQILLESNAKGVFLQSQIEAKPFLEGLYIKPFYGNV